MMTKTIPIDVILAVYVVPVKEYNLHSLIPERCGTIFKNIISKLIIQDGSLDSICEIALKWMSQVCNEKWKLVKVMTSCCQATSHYPNQCRPRSMSSCGVTVPQWVNTLRPRHYGRHFPDDIFKRICLNENVSISLKILLKFVPKVQFNNIAALVQIMAWRRPGAKPLSEPMMVSLLTHICFTRPQWVNGEA